MLEQQVDTDVTKSEFHNAIMIDGQEVPLQDLDSQPDRRTFGEIEDDEQTQWNTIYNNLKDHEFHDTTGQNNLVPKPARFFVGDCILHALKTLGANLDTMSLWHKKYTKEELEKRLWAMWKIRLSKHRPSQHDEIWQSGTYIYKDKELVYFIGSPKRFQGQFIKVVTPFWIVRTNIQLPGGKGVRTR